MLYVVKNACSCLIMLFFLNGCITIHNLNVVSDDTPPSTPVAISTIGIIEDGSAGAQPPVPMNELDNAGGASTGAQTPVAISEMGNPKPPGRSLSSFATSEYAIRNGDTFDVKFFYHPELNESVKVRPDGRISLQLVHDIQASSLSPNELVALLKQKYSFHIKDPEISVIIRSSEAKKVYVDGEVRASGMVKLSHNMTIMQAIASAKGLRNTARRSEVLLIRRNGLKRPFVYQINVGAAMAGTDMAQNVVLKPFDIVYVPKSTIANVNTWVDMYIRKNIPIGVSYNLGTLNLE